MGHVQGFNHHGITVGDMDRALALFVDVLKFERGATVELDPGFTSAVTGVNDSALRAVFVHGPGVDVELLAYERRDGTDARPVAPNRPGASHIAFFVDDLRQVADDAAQVGWALAGSIAPIVSGPRAGGSAAYLRDPDGVTVELVQRPDSLSG